MTEPLEGHPFPPGSEDRRAALVAAMTGYAAAVLHPSLALKRLGIYRPPATGGPLPPPAPGLGAHFCRLHPLPVLAGGQSRTRPDPDAARAWRDYERATRAWSAPVFGEALTLLARHLDPAARVLDTSYGAGTGALAVAELVPGGEVVVAGPDAELVLIAFEEARAAGAGNMAFLQAGLAELPAELDGAFDAAFSFLAFHRLPDPAAAAAELYRVLRPGGAVVVADPGPGWFAEASRGLATWAEPGFTTYHDAEAMERILRGAGFTGFAWEELLPGIGCAAAVR